MVNKYSVTFNIEGIGSLSVGEALNQLNIKSGSDGYDLANPSVMSAEFLINTNDQTAPFWIGRQISVSVTPAGQLPFNLFFGYVTTCSVQPLNPEGSFAIVSITAGSQMMRLSNYNVGGSGFAAQTERDRAIALNNETSNATWENTPNGLTWLDVDPTTTWEFIDDDYRLALISFAGLFGFDLESYTDGETDALSFLQNWATGTNAWIFDDVDSPNTIIAFHEYWTGVGAENLDLATCGLWESLGVQNDLSNVYTNVIFANSTTSANYTNFNQLAQFGERSVTVTSPLANTNDLQTLATERGIALSVPQTSLTTIAIDCDLVSYAKQKKLMRFTDPVVWNLQNVPEIFGGNQTYFQTGINLSLNCYHAEVELNILPESVRQGLTQWQEVTYSWLWNNYLTSTTTWADVN